MKRYYWDVLVGKLILFIGIIEAALSWTDGELVRISLAVTLVAVGIAQVWISFHFPDSGRG